MKAENRLRPQMQTWATGPAPDSSVSPIEQFARPALSIEFREASHRNNNWLACSMLSLKMLVRIHAGSVRSYPVQTQARAWLLKESFFYTRDMFHVSGSKTFVLDRDGQLNFRYD